MKDELKNEFHLAMLKIHSDGLNLKPPYLANRYKSLVIDVGGYEAAIKLLSTDKPSSGFNELFLRGKENLKISVEYLVLTPKWCKYFDEYYLNKARKRLTDVGCPLPSDE